METQPAQRSGELRFISGVICLGITAVAVWLALVALAPSAFGWSPVVITSGSMTPTIRPGDIVVAAPPGDEPFEEGDVVVFDSGAGQTTHRILTVNPDGTYTTRGDASVSPDAEPVEHDDVLGTGKILVPLAGLPRSWMLNGEPALAVLCLTLFSAVAWASRFGLLARYEPAPTAPRPPRPSCDRPRSPARRARPVLRLTSLLLATVVGALATGGTAVAAFGDLSAVPDNAWTSATIPPPTSADATAHCDAGTLHVAITWQPGADPAVDGYIVYRVADGTAPVLVGETGAQVTSLTDGGVQPESDYRYDVHSTAGRWTSPTAATAPVTTPACASEPTGDPSPDPEPTSEPSPEPEPTP